MTKVSATQVLKHFSKYKPNLFWEKDELYFREVLLYEAGQPVLNRDSLYICRGAALESSVLDSGNCFLCIDRPPQELYEQYKHKPVIILEASGLTLAGICNLAQELFDSNFQKC